MSRTRAVATMAPWSDRPLTPEEVRPGDLVFIGAEDTALGALVSELDGCHFSHVGVLWETEPPRMVSARTDRTASIDSPDLGGVRRNDLVDLRGRGVHVAPLALSEEVRAAGLAALDRWDEDPRGPDPASYSRFSFAKLVIVATALAAVRRRSPLPPEGAEELWTASLRAAEELRWGGGFPGFYCAEVIAGCFDLEFTVASFCVPDGEPHPVGVPDGAAEPAAAPASAPDPTSGAEAPGGAALVDVTDGSHVAGVSEAHDDLAEVIRDLVDAYREVDLSFGQVAAVADLLVTVWRHDRPLGRRLVAAGWELLGRPEPREPAPAPAVPYVPPAFLDRWPGPLPDALVTPRMLLSSSVVRSVHPLDLG